MSQAGIVDFIGTHPEIPILFVANVGSAVPIANTLEILGQAVAAHSVPLQTVGSGNTIEIDVQYSSAAATSVANNAGVASFNSAQFTVDANGYVSISGAAIVSSFTVDAFTGPGTNPVVPNGSGNITVTGGQVAAGTTANVIRTDSLAANTYTIQIQRSQAVASSTIGDNGVSHFNSTFFTVDANGFVSLNGSAVGETITGNIGGALPPTAGNWNIFGSAVASGTTPVQTSGSGSTLTVQVQRSQAIASTNATNVGLAAFNSAFFTVDANGFVSLNGSAVGETITGNVGGALSPTAGNWNIFGASTAAGTTPVQTSGTGSTLTVQVQKSQAIASTNATNVGLAAFSSAQFVVDANGFVTLNGAAVGETITGNTGGALSPTAGNWNILGSSTAPGTTPVQTSGTGSTLTIQVQKSQAIVSTNATNVGLAAFNSAFFTVDSNGFVSLNGSAVGETITGNTGGALSPTAGNWNILGTSTAAGTTPVQTAGSGSTLTVQVQKAQAIASTNATNVGLAAFNSAQFTVDANGFVSTNGSGVLSTLSDDVNTVVTPSAGNIQLVGHVNEQGATKFSTVVAGSHLININPMSPARWIVDPLGFNGTHTTIASAIASATSGDTIQILPSTYTENLTLKAGVNLTGYGCDGFGNIIIAGKCTFTAAGNVACSGILFKTNSDFAISVTGSANSFISFTDCAIVGSNNTAIQLNSSGTSAALYFQSCTFDLQTTGIAYYTMAAGNNIHFIGCFFNNSGNSTTASNNAAGNALFEACSTFGSYSSTSTGSLGIFSCNVDTSSINATTLTFGGSGSNLVIASYIAGGTASAISVSSAATVLNSTVQSSNTNVITGAGTINTGYNVYTGSKVVNTTTKTYSPVTISNQTFTSNGTYTPTTGMKYCSVRMLGGGGGGGGAATSGAANCAIGGSGGSGEYAEGIIQFNTIGTSQTVTIGAAGAAGTAGANAGGTGGTTSLGALITAIGGTGGAGGGTATVNNTAGGAGGTGGTGGDFRTPGHYGATSLSVGTTGPLAGGNGANSQYGSGGLGRVGGPGAGNAGLGYGAGGSGGATFNSTQQAGGAGTAGLIVITEYIFS